jgi:PAP2 superfamily
MTSLSSISSVRSESRSTTWLRATVRDLAPPDWLLIAYFVLLFVGVLFGAGPDRPYAGELVVVDLAALLAGLALTRGGALSRDTFLGRLAYRLTLFLPFFASYFQLRIILPAGAPRVEDPALYAIDRALFHYEPALAWDRFVTPARTEWFAFFYFGYFFMFALYVFSFMLAAKNVKVLGRFAFAAFFTSGCGHLLYMVIPGFGPYHYLAGSFTNELSGGFFWHAVLATVSGAGPQKDIFPSLHTAVPSMLSLFAFRYRKESTALRYAWPISAFCASQIVIATLYLRWHYVIDVCAGLALAVLTVVVAERAARWDEDRRAALGLRPAWTRLAPKGTPDQTLARPAL